jgi:hypothetical protein
LALDASARQAEAFAVVTANPYVLEAAMRFVKKMSSYRLVVACLFLAAACSSPVERQAAATTSVTVFEGARLITGDGGAPIENSAWIWKAWLRWA